MGLRVPQDVCIVGCDGITDTEYLETPVSTLAKPVNEMCSMAWRFLQARIADPALPLQAATLLARLEVRESSLRRKA
jgi:LacI family transcriptional regulator